MNHKNYMKLVFPSYAVNEAFARTTVACFISQLNPTLEQMGDIRNAVSEAVSNCIIHAYPNLSNNVISIIIKDRGVGIQSTPEEHSGMGFTKINRIMTSVKVVSSPDKGTTVYLKSKIDKTQG